MHLMPGIKADFINLEPQHVCGLCKLVIRSPMQADCGHIFCNDCLQEAMNDKGKMLCPIDREKISQVSSRNPVTIKYCYYIDVPRYCIQKRDTKVNGEMSFC